MFLTFVKTWFSVCLLIFVVYEKDFEKVFKKSLRNIIQKLIITTVTKIN